TLISRPPSSTPFPYTTLFRSSSIDRGLAHHSGTAGGRLCRLVAEDDPRAAGGADLPLGIRRAAAGDVPDLRCGDGGGDEAVETAQGRAGVKKPARGGLREG